MPFLLPAAAAANCPVTPTVTGSETWTLTNASDEAWCAWLAHMRQEEEMRSILEPIRRMQTADLRPVVGSVIMRKFQNANSKQSNAKETETKKDSASANKVERPREDRGSQYSAWPASASNRGCIGINLHSGLNGLNLHILT